MPEPSLFEVELERLPGPETVRTRIRYLADGVIAIVSEIVN